MVRIRQRAPHYNISNSAGKLSSEGLQNLGICGSSSAGRASRCQREGREFDPRLPLHQNADVAQLVEHLHGKEGVTGSSPVIGSSFLELRKWRNWQTRKVEGLVRANLVRVQVPSSAPLFFFGGSRQKTNKEPWCSWLTHRPVKPESAGSSPVGSAIHWGVAKLGKAQDFDSCIPWFESRRPSQCRDSSVGRAGD